MLQKYFYHCIDSCDDENDKLRNLRCNITQMSKLTWNKLSEFVAKRVSQTDLGCWPIHILGVSWSNLTCAYFADGLGKTPHHLDHINIQLPKAPKKWPSLTPPGGKAGWHPGPIFESEGADDLRELALLSSLASMGHWEVALQCLSFPSRPGPGGGLVVWWCRKFDGFAGSFGSVRVSCLLYKVLLNETQGFFF